MFCWKKKKKVYALINLALLILFWKRQRTELECQALKFPRTQLDIDTLLHQLETFTTSLPDGLYPRSHRLEMLESRQKAHLFVESKMRNVRIANAQAAKERFLVVSCRPTKWRNEKLLNVEMLTLKNQAAIVYRDLYEMLKVEEPNNRMEILVKVGYYATRKSMYQ